MDGANPNPDYPYAIPVGLPSEDVITGWGEIVKKHNNVYLWVGWSGTHLDTTILFELSGFGRPGTHLGTTVSF